MDMQQPQANESQVTLVDPSFASEPAEVLYFIPDDTKNTTVTRRRGGQILYTFKTNRTGLETIYSTPDHRGQEMRNTKNWLKYGGLLEIKLPEANFANGYAAPLNSRKVEIHMAYVWKSSIIGELSLYAEHDLDTPIAWFSKSMKRVLDHQLTVSRAYLALQPEAIEIQDMVVMSFLVLEQKNRMVLKGKELSAGRAALDVMRPI